MPKYLNDISSLRHASVYDPLANKDTCHLIIGNGAIGSWQAELLVRLGANDIRLIDFDEVEPHNVANQRFYNSDTGKKKSDALKDILERDFPVGIIKSYDMKVDDDSDLPIDDVMKVIVYLSVDSIKSRTEILEVIRSYTNIALVVDSRMSIDRVISVAFDPKDDALYETWKKSLPPEDAPVETDTCGSPISIISNVFVIAGLSVDHMIQHTNDPTADFAVIHRFRGNNGTYVDIDDAREGKNVKPY